MWNMEKVILIIILVILTGCNINNIPKEEVQKINETKNEVVNMKNDSERKLDLAPTITLNNGIDIMTCLELKMVKLQNIGM